MPTPANNNAETSTTVEATPANGSKAKGSASQILQTTRDRAGEAGRRAAEGIESNPLAVLVGGVAIGAVAAALLPRTTQEAKLLGPVGRRITDGAAGAVAAAREAGKTELDNLGLTRLAAKDSAGKFAEGLLKAAVAVGTAAATRTATAAKHGAEEASQTS